ncbi:MAG: hypothetical protein QHJ34_13410 [bacterium]|jgi:hypothetical protein|nr:hypothetical protein [candidate division KSB1 bacterium]MDH7561210.1 hypothetical protein [bacterium]
MLTKLLLAYLRFLARRSVAEEPIQFWDELRQATKATVALPCSPEDLKALRRVVGRLSQLFAPENLCFVVRQGELPPPGLIQGRLIEVGPDMLRFGHLPTARLRQRLRAQHVDAFIDLHHEFDLLSAALAVASGARIRVCLAHRLREPFYNLEVRTAAGVSPAKRYDRLLAVLEAARASKDPEVLPSAKT